jgi:hypothetical protein
MIATAKGKEVGNRGKETSCFVQATEPGISAAQPSAQAGEPKSICSGSITFRAAIEKSWIEGTYHESKQPLTGKQFVLIHHHIIKNPR